MSKEKPSELTKEAVEALGPVFAGLQQKLRVANGSLRSALKEVEDWRNAAVAGKEALERTTARVEGVLTKSEGTIKELRRRAISCCFCGCDNESLEALKAHSAVCPKHPAVQRAEAAEHRLQCTLEDERLETIRTWDITKPGAIRALFDFIEGCWNRDMGAIRACSSAALGVIESPAYLANSRLQEFVTGGWSENEEILSALAMNAPAYSMTWRASFSGGLHVFEIGDLHGVSENAETS